MDLKKASILIGLSVLLTAMGFFFWTSRSNEETVLTEGTAEELNSEENELESEDEPTEENQNEEVDNSPIFYEGEFELPIEGAAGFASTDVPLYASSSKEGEVQTRLTPGTPFEILSEEGNWWNIQTADASGWIEHKFAFINLPDVISSIIYDNTNSYAAMYTSSLEAIPNLTNEPLYSAVDYNERLDKETFIMPILYSTAKKVNRAQQNALQNDEALKIYETFRPFETQQLVVESLDTFAKENEAIDAGLNNGPWTQGWFIITGGVSNHQVGAAMDVSLVSVDSFEETVVGDYSVPTVSAHTELEMQTPMHELSTESVIFEKTVSSNDKKELLAEPLIEKVTEPSVRLHQYAKEAGFTPIASEWWHFNDLDTVELLGEDAGRGEFYITQTLNSQPKQ